MRLRLALALLAVAIVVSAAWYGNKRIEEGGYLRDREGIANLEAMARLAEESRDWSGAEAVYAELNDLI